MKKDGANGMLFAIGSQLPDHLLRRRDYSSKFDDRDLLPRAGNHRLGRIVANFAYELDKHEDRSDCEKCEHPEDDEKPTSGFGHGRQEGCNLLI